MINENEVMPFNWILQPSVDVFCRDGINTSFEKVMKPFQLEFGMITMKIPNVDWSDCEYIPITPEILEECGFNNDFNKKLWLAATSRWVFWFDYNDVEWLHIVDAHYKSDVFKGIKEIPCKYLHQLQNFIMMFSGVQITWEQKQLQDESIAG